MAARKARRPATDKAVGGPSGFSAGEPGDLQANPQQPELQADNSVLRRHAEEIRSLAKRTVEDILKIGRLLTDAKKRIPHGGWLPWLDRELGWSADTATNFMNVYKLSRRPKFRKIRNLTKLAPSVLYALAKAPDEVAVPIMDRIERGESISPRSVAATVAEHTQKIVTPYYVKPDAPRSSRPWPSRAVQFPASVAEPEQPADDEREMRSAAKKVRSAPLTAREADDWSEETEPNIEEDSENYRTAYLIRVDQARRFAVYSGPISADIIAGARQVAAAWAALADELERRLHGEEARGMKADENAASHERMLEGLKATADTEAHLRPWYERCKAAALEGEQEHVPSLVELAREGAARKAAMGFPLPPIPKRRGQP